MTVNWSKRAEADLDRIFTKIEEDNPRAAEKVANRIYAQLLSLASMPERKTPGRTPSTREMFFPPWPYFAVYRIVGDEVRILHIRHTSRRWPTSATL